MKVKKERNSISVYTSNPIQGNTEVVKSVVEIQDSTRANGSLVVKKKYVMFETLGSPKHLGKDLIMTFQEGLQKGKLNMFAVLDELMEMGGVEVDKRCATEEGVKYLYVIDFIRKSVRCKDRKNLEINLNCFKPTRLTNIGRI